MALKKIRFNNRANKEYFATLNSRIREYLKNKNQSQYANAQYWAKILLFVGTMVGTYLVVMLQLVSPAIMFPLGILFTVTALFLGFNVAHDASHNALFKTTKYNMWFVRTFDLIGISGYLWIIKHCGSHHKYTNIPEYDADIAQQKLLRISPSTKMRKGHRFQQFYAPLLYMNFTLFLVYFKDFNMLASKSIGSEENLKHPIGEILLVIFSKVLYTTYALVLPLLILDVSPGWIVFNFVASHWVASFLAMMVLLPVHVIDSSEFPEPDQDGNMNQSWAVHQVDVTQDFGTANGVAGFFFGGLNYHIVHHLFPTICHIHYGPITKIIKKTSKEFGVNYVSNSWMGAMGKHFKFLKKMGRDETAYLASEPGVNPKGKAKAQTADLAG